MDSLITRGALVVGDGYRAKNDELARAGLPFARVGNINNGFHFADADRFPPRDLAKVGNKISQPGDVVFTSKGSVGRFAYVDQHTERFVYSPQLCFWRTVDRRLIQPRYLYYWMHGPEFFTQFKGVSGQTDMAEYVSLTDQRRMQITLPPLHQQEGIVAVLGVLDDKIDLNRRMNETLEAMARAIFKDWFVDFAPTRAKMESRLPYLASDLWSLFPQHFGQTGMPSGWKAEPLLDHVRLLSGGTPKTGVAAYWNGPVQWASAKDVSQCSAGFLIATERTITERGLKESATRVIPKAATVVIARGATTGRFCMFGRPMAMNQTCYALESKREHPYWLNCAFGGLVEILVHAAHGSVFDTITTRTIEGARIVDPGAALLGAFEERVTPLFDRILANIEETAILTAMRDLLLPKLMSGEVTVRDAEKRLVAVT